MLVMPRCALQYEMQTVTYPTYQPIFCHLRDHGRASQEPTITDKYIMTVARAFDVDHRKKPSSATVMLLLDRRSLLNG